MVRINLRKINEILRKVATPWPLIPFHMARKKLGAMMGALEAKRKWKEEVLEAKRRVKARSEAETVEETNGESQNLDPCPDERELKVYASGDSPNSRLRRIVACHVDVCPSCRDRLEKIRDPNIASEDRIKLYATRLRKHQEELVVQKWRGPRQGTLWRTFPESGDEIFGPS